ncbi:hypothetical protein EXIGLDRAFT_311831 [Exidia glandulosa HHB12029]|uniref:Uncharacterized protein n=1 Tax=Exidia glandulosa HHB12029 TaxID=1314781 RepID=A0A165CZK2_EXIGL|nr:hypothetical protein EXIGLDRAFT_311831 [Exidia glandulosa HHB12029]
MNQRANKQRVTHSASNRARIHAQTRPTRPLPQRVYPAARRWETSPSPLLCPPMATCTASSVKLRQAQNSGSDLLGAAWVARWSFGETLLPVGEGMVVREDFVLERAVGF